MESNCELFNIVNLNFLKWKDDNDGWFTETVKRIENLSLIQMCYCCRFLKWDGLHSVKVVRKEI